MANDVVPLYEESDRVSAHAANALTGGRFVAITGRQSGKAAGTGINLHLDTNAAGGNYTADVPGAGVYCMGVAAHDAASGEKVTIICEGIVSLITGTGGVTAGSLVEVDAAGKPVNLSTGKAVGLALTSASAAAAADIKLFG
jgi:predicted RecA/RadA family phage recombinase